MSSSLNKVKKQIAKKRNGRTNCLHAKSRDSLRLSKASSRDQRLGKLASSRNKKEKPILARVNFFQDALRERGGGVQELSVVQELIEQFLHRHDEEYDELRKERRQGRSATMREDLVKMTIDNLQEEHQKGFALPDIMNEENVQRLENWDGSWTQLSTLTWIKVTDQDSVRPTELPTRG